MPEVSIATLRALHRAHVERVPYETYDLYLGRPPSLDPGVSAARVVGGRGGFCYHLNGAFSLLLATLGFTVTRHRAGVHLHDEPPPRTILGDHLALTVSGLPTDAAPCGRWLIDVGLGDALYEPIPLRPGRYQQGPFEFGLRASPLAPGGWRFEHDPQGTFVGFDVAPEPVTMSAFADVGEQLASSPESAFVRVPLAERRDRDGVDMLRGCVLTRIDASGKHSITVDQRDAWFSLLAERFGLGLTELDAATRADLWRRVRADQLARMISGH